MSHTIAQIVLALVAFAVGVFTGRRWSDRLRRRVEQVVTDGRVPPRRSLDVLPAVDSADGSADQADTAVEPDHIRLCALEAALQVTSRQAARLEHELRVAQRTVRDLERDAGRLTIEADDLRAELVAANDWAQIAWRSRAARSVRAHPSSARSSDVVAGNAMWN